MTGPELPALDEPRAIVLVEGASDRMAVSAAAARLGIDLEARRIAVVVLGGIQGLFRMLPLLGPRNPRTVCGLYDEAEESVVREALERIAPALLADGTLEDAGWFACRRDLEDEIIRACGTAFAESRLDAEGELAAFRRMQQQPAWRGREPSDQLRRWIAGGARRKLRYARILVEALPPERVPRPLVRVLERASQA